MEREIRRPSHSALDAAAHDNQRNEIAEKDGTPRARFHSQLSQQSQRKRNCPMTTRTVASILVSAALAISNFDASAQTTIPGFTLGNMDVSEGGSANYTIPIQVPPGISGMEPKLYLNYSSNG